MADAPIIPDTTEPPPLVADQAGQYTLINPVSGESIKVPSYGLDDALKVGYLRPQSDSDLQRALHTSAVREDAKSASSGMAALLEGAGSTLTFGGSSWLERAMGADPEAMRAREEEHPFLSGAGQVIGAALPIVFSGGAAAPEEAALEAGATGLRATSPEYLAQVGKLGEEALARDPAQTLGINAKSADELRSMISQTTDAREQMADIANQAPSADLHLPKMPKSVSDEYLKHNEDMRQALVGEMDFSKAADEAKQYAQGNFGTGVPTLNRSPAEWMKVSDRQAAKAAAYHRDAEAFSQKMEDLRSKYRDPFSPESQVESLDKELQNLQLRLDERTGMAQQEGMKINPPEPGTYEDWQQRSQSGNFEGPEEAPLQDKLHWTDFTAPGLISKAGTALREGLSRRLAPGVADVEKNALIEGFVDNEGVAEGYGNAVRPVNPGTLDPITTDLPGLRTRLLSKALSTAVGYGAEGALYGAGDVNHEAALDNPMSLGEAAAHIGLSSLFAGGIGAGAGALGELGTQFAPKLIEFLKNKQGEQFAKALELTNDQTKDYKSILTKASDEGYIHPFSTPESIQSAAVKGMEDANTRLDQTLGRIAANPRTAFQGVGDMESVLGKLNEAFIVGGDEGTGPAVSVPGRREMWKILHQFEGDLTSKYGSWIPKGTTAEDVLGGKAGLYSNTLGPKIPVTMQDAFSLYRKMTSVGTPQDKLNSARWLDENLLEKSFEGVGGKAQQAWESWKGTRDLTRDLDEIVHVVQTNPGMESRLGAWDAAELIAGMHGGPVAAAGAAAEHWLRTTYGPGLAGELAKHLKKAAGVLSVPGLASKFHLAVGDPPFIEKDPYLLEGVESLIGKLDPSVSSVEAGRESARLAQAVEEKEKKIPGTPEMKNPETVPHSRVGPDGKLVGADEIINGDKTVPHTSAPTVLPDGSVPPAHLDPRLGSPIPPMDPAQAAATSGILVGAEQRIKARMAEAAEAILGSKHPGSFAGSAIPDKDLSSIVSRLFSLSDPNKMGEALDHITGELGKVAPQVSMSSGQAVTRALQYLQASAPLPGTPSLMSPEGTSPGPYQEAKFRQALEVALDPVRALVQNQTAGTFQAIQSIYPQIADQMQGELLAGISSRPTPPSYQDVMKISTLIGVPLTSGQMIPSLPVPADIPLSSGGLGRGSGKIKGSKAGAGKLSKSLWRLSSEQQFGSKED